MTEAQNTEDYLVSSPSTVFLLFLFLFLGGCILGYILELFFRRLVTAKKWVNPGFMRGPWLPLYGFGLSLMFLICWFFYRNLPSTWHLYNPKGGIFGLDYQSGPTVVDLIPIASMGIGMTLLELIAGIIFVRGFKVRLWDYSNMKGNIMGVICPLFSLIWLSVSILFYYAVNPFMYALSIDASLFMFGDTIGSHAANFLFIFFMGVAYGIMLIDFITSIGLFNKISKTAKHSGIVARYEKLKEARKIQSRESRKRFMDSLPEAIRKSLEAEAKLKEQANELLDKTKAVFLIDPEAEKDPSENYDADGRPLREDEPTEEKKD